MTQFAETYHAPRASQRIVARTFAPLRAGWRQWRCERQLRATVAALHRLDDHMLRDIGLSRGDIEAGVRRLAPRR